ncbi:MAG: ribosomal RNA small subunit methyltransferase A [SAR86 cluster bacterium]|jgi:16S rRNA (adenine1518-N6/adenine1519-N6)-dimethyltransferase|uniref:Ribosomal RNA small subunit methyltransferase A n=1 Tax=SAR86 cluster bacterium TaxID=2030880 RepID=A0A520N4M3_9GAMM|nr:MAG: ribosomal RNA small subunit methyltransferase A [SAR86 cluster bacterium]|tara:strand:+ start:1415 stop:2182 length:768 start_codon:yes stop_codon:yes gene_type:complete
MSSRDIRRKYGQNYLIDPAILFEMGEVISPNDSDNFIEIGPGIGALTNQINTENINITAIDIDANNIETLKNKFKGPANFNFINEDILKFKLEDLRVDKRIVGNLPYNISTQIILKLLNDYQKIIDMHFLVQKEVAQKITGQVASKNWGKLAIKISAFFNSEILFDVPPEAFDIKPKVNSSFIRLLPKKDLNYDLSIKDNLYKIIDLAFSSKRKNIKNNLKKLDIDWDKTNIDPTKRSEEIPLTDFINLAKVYSA